MAIWLRTCIFLISLLLANGCSWVIQKSEKQPRAVQGELDLRNWDFEKDGPVWLEGEFFYLDGWVDPDTFDPADLTKTPIMNIPTNLSSKKAVDPAFMLTLIIKLKLPSRELILSLDSLRNFYPERINIYQDKAEFLLATGHFGEDFQRTDFNVQRRIAQLPKSFPDRETYLIIHAKPAWFHTLAMPAKIGLSTTLMRDLVLETSETFVLVGCYFTIVIYCFFLYLQQRTNLTQFFAGILTLGFLLRYLATETAFSLIFGLTFKADWNALGFLGTALSNLGALGLLSYVFHPRFHKKIVTPLLWLSCPLSILLLAVPFHPSIHRSMFEQGTVPFFLIFGILGIFNNFYAIIMSLKQRGSFLYLGIGSALVSTSTILDTLVASNVVSITYTAHYSNLIFCLAITLTISQRFAETYRQNEKLLTEVQEKEKARTLFFHNTSHELRTPLNGIVGFMQLILQGRYGKLDKAVEEQVGKSLRLALSLKNQVNTILDLAKSRKGQMTLTNSIVSLDELAAEMEDLASGLQLRKESSKFQFARLWNEQNRSFVTDKEKLSMVLRNLIGNAFKFADPERPNHVSLKLERLPHSIRIEVKDTGIGIPDDQKDRVFEEFQQVAGDARRAYEGTGLGLAMVRDIVKLMGGRLELSTQLGVGSSFIVELPEQSEIHLRQISETMALASIKADEQKLTTIRPEAAKGQGPHILVVDDHELNCELLRDILQEEGYTISVAFGGQEALQFLRQKHPDLVLLDMMMPYVSGEDVIKAMQADTLMQDIPVILITARASEDDRLFGLSLGADDYLAKPIHHEELLFRVRNILHRAETIHRMAVVEERERLAQLGQLMRDLSHELKNVFQLDQQDPAETQRTSELILQRLPLQAPAWLQAIPLIAADDKINATDVRLEPYGFLNKAAQTDRSLRYLRSIVAQLPLNEERRQELWQHLQSQTPETWQECESSIHYIRNHSALMDQTKYASELIVSILDYSRTREDQAYSDLSIVIPKVVKLIQPKLHKYRINVDLTLKPYVARINPAQLMQIVLNLFINAADAISDLKSEEKWIQLSVLEASDAITILVKNGGPPLPPDVIVRLFHEGESTKGSKGNGLGLVISQRILMRISGELTYDSGSLHPCFVIRLPWLQEDSHAVQTA